VLEEVLRAGGSLATLSERGRIVRELNDPTIRELLVFKYRLLYEVEDHRVLIVALLHGARDFATWRRTQQQE
jgi:toxin ParE1/3/4